MEEIKLTQYSKGSGCGCKIAPAALEKILKSQLPSANDKRLIVGNESADDAAVYDLRNDEYLISTTDFFTPIVDDPETFGKIAAANAISDIYAMGGKPIVAIAVLGWPVEKISLDIATKVLDGARKICAEAGIVIAGGHSIDIPEPVFGLSVNGLVKPKNLKKNNTAKEGDILCLTKPLGVGILSTAEKRNVLKPEHKNSAAGFMTKLNKAGILLGELNFVHAMTDITGFGLLGHTIEMAQGSGLSAEINYSSVPIITEAKEYAAQFIYPDNTMRNWSSYKSKTDGIGTESLLTLCDPQTNGGLLFSIEAGKEEEIKKLFSEMKEEVYFVGKMNGKSDKIIYIS